MQNCLPNYLYLEEGQHLGKYLKTAIDQAVDVEAIVRALKNQPAQCRI